MKPPVEHVRVSARSKEILIKIKRRTGLEHWNEICRIALCRSLANPTQPPKVHKFEDSTIDMDWKVFAGTMQKELSAILIMRMHHDGINIIKKESISDYFRNHLERGIQSIQNVKSLNELLAT